MAIFYNFFFQAIQGRKMSFTILQSEKSPFQAIKARSSNILKIDIFPKGLTPGMGQEWPFFNLFFFQAIQVRKMSFTIFQNEKSPFQAIKTRSLKTRKIVIFPKWLTHGFGTKMSILPTFFFQAIQAGKMSFTIFYNEKSPFYAIKTRCSNIRKIDIFPKVLTLGMGQAWPFFNLFFFQAIQVRKMSFTIFQNEKLPFQVIKTRSLKSRKIVIFPKWLTHGFGPKMAIFATFFLCNIGQENVFQDILE